MAGRDIEPEQVDKTPKANVVIPVTIARALIEIQKTLKPMLKTAENDAFGSSYVPLEEVTEKAHEMLASRGIGVSQPPTTDAYGHAALETILFTGSGQSFSRTTKLALSKVDPQAHGSAITYTRRYALMATLGLTGKGEDDDGNKAAGVFPPVKKEQKEELDSLMIHLKYTPEQRAAEIFKVKTYDHAQLALTNFRKLASMRVRDDESKANATKIEVGTDDADDGKSDEPANVDPRSEGGFKRRLKSLRLAGPTYEKKVIHMATGAPFLARVMDKPERIEALDVFLTALESGVRKLEAEFYAPRLDENIIVDENVA